MEEEVVNTQEQVSYELELEDFYENAPCGFHSIDANGIFVRINKTESEWLGYSKEEMVGKKMFLDILSEKSKVVFLERFPVFKKTGLLRNQEFEFVTKQGKVFPVLVNATALFDDNRNYVMSRSTVTDLTAMKFVQQNLQYTNRELLNVQKELEEKNRHLAYLNEQKNHFIGVASHDLNNPLSTAYLLTESFRTKPENLTPDQLKKLDVLADSINRMVSMVKNLLNVNLIDEGKVQVSYAKLIAEDAVLSVLSEFEEFAKRKNLTLIFESGIEGKEVLTDKVLLTEILENLISNAIKFSLPDKRIIVRSSVTESEWQLEVEDEGQGIKEEEMPLLFGKFRKLSSRPTAGESSTGLGLSIVKDYIKILKGKITCESIWQKGTRFIMAFPQASVRTAF